MNTIRRFLAAMLCAVCALLALGQAHAQEHIIKFATIATDGSTWLNVLRDYDAAIRKESGGRMGFKIYAGGVQGEDKDVIAKDPARSIAQRRRHRRGPRRSEPQAAHPGLPVPFQELPGSGLLSLRLRCGTRPGRQTERVRAPRLGRSGICLRVHQYAGPRLWPTWTA